MLRAPRRVATAVAALVVVASVAAAVAVGAGASVEAAGAADEVSVAASEGAHRPALSFGDTQQYTVPYYGYVWTDGDKIVTPAAAPTNRGSYFGQASLVQRDPGGAANIAFAVEDQSSGAFHRACAAGEGCNDIAVRITPQGALYLYLPRASQQTRFSDVHLGGFASRAVELSAAQADTGHKVYREVSVGPPAESADCEDYTDASAESFTCLYLRELLPAGQATARADEAALRAKLPKLVQDAANYNLAFAEEFNGTPSEADAEGCRNGLSTLDAAVWNYYNACDDVDSKGEPCSNVGGGGFTMGISSRCGFGSIAGILLATRGHLHMKYGYIEAKYTFEIDHWQGVYHNYNMILNVAGGGLHYLRDQHGIDVNDWEDYLKTSQVEIDIFEMPSTASFNVQPEVSHQYGNWNGDIDENKVRPTRTVKYTHYCSRPVHRSERGIVSNPDACTNTDTFTVTRGIEWTPRGYRTYIWVDGLQDGLTLLPKSQISIQQKHHGVALRPFQGRRAAPFFENLVPGDPSTLLEQAAVSHIPLPINLNAWGWLDRDKYTHIRRRMTFDYVRVWKPANDYTDMEPVYQ